MITFIFITLFNSTFCFEESVIVTSPVFLITREEPTTLIIERFEDDNQIQQRELLYFPLTRKQVKQIEKWTGLKCKEIIFDSNKDDWKMTTTVFNNKIFNKNHLLFLIED